MKAKVAPGKPTDTRSYKLRVYPNGEQKAWMENCCKARQWAYNLGIKLYKDAWRERLDAVKLDPGTMCQVQTLSKIKRLSANVVSRLITVFLQEVREHQKQFEKQVAWAEKAQTRQIKKGLAKLSVVDLSLLYLQQKEKLWLKPHAFAWLLEVPRSVLTQGVNDYGSSLDAKFEDMKKPRGERLGRGWPKLAALHESSSFRVQLEKPSTSQHLKASWSQNRIPLGEKDQGSVYYRDDLALPKKIPSLITFSQSGSGKWHATFAVKVKESREFQNPARTQREAIKADEREALTTLLSLEGNTRALGHDPNFDHWAMTDSAGLTMLALQPRQRREDRAKQARRDRYFSRTSPGRKSNRRLSIEGKSPSMRSRKAKQKCAALREHGANITLDYQRKLACILGGFYSRHHFEGTNHKALRKSKRRGNAFAWADGAPGKQVDLIKQACAKADTDTLFITCPSHFPSSQQCWACKTINPQVKDGRKTWTCKNPQCGMFHHRDECASKNVLDEGFRISPQKAPNTLKEKEGSLPRCSSSTTPLGEGYCANQTENASLFERALKERFERSGLFVQVRSIHLPRNIGMETMLRGGR